MSSSGHGGSRGLSKISYATREAAVVAAQRRYDEDCIRLWPYRCKKVRADSIHPVLQREHWHLTSQQPGTRKRVNATRWHEEWNGELGPRVVGCLVGENSWTQERRVNVLVTRARATERRRGRCSS